MPAALYTMEIYPMKATAAQVPPNWPVAQARDKGRWRGLWQNETHSFLVLKIANNTERDAFLSLVWACSPVQASPVPTEPAHSTRLLR